MRRFFWLLLIFNAPALVCLLETLRSRTPSGHMSMLLAWLFVVMTPYFFLPAMASAIVGVGDAFYPFGWAIFVSERGLLFTFAFYALIALLVSRVLSARSSAKVELGDITLDPLVRAWWATAGRGVLAFLLGLTLVMAPTFLHLIAIYMLADGILTIVAVVWSGGWGMIGVFLALKGLVSVLSGTYLRLASWILEHGYLTRLLWPLALWGILGGLFEVAAGVQLIHRYREWLLLLNGAVTVLVITTLTSVLLHGYTDTWITVWWPVVGRWVGVLGLLSGVILLTLAARLRASARNG